MSYSNIIKLHRIQHQKVLVGQWVPSARCVGADGLQNEGQEPGSERIGDGGTAGAADHRQDHAAAEAQDILNKARAEAKGILQETNRKAEQIRLRAKEVGYRKGYQEGLNQAKTATSENVRRIAELAKNACVDMSAILNTLEEDIVELALSVAEKVVHKRLAEDRSLILSMVQGALEYVDLVEVIRIRVNPEDLDLLRSHWERGHVDVLGRNVELAPDSRVQVGGCVIDTKSSVVDAQIETKLAEIEKAFRSELEGNAR